MAFVMDSNAWVFHEFTFHGKTWHAHGEIRGCKAHEIILKYRYNISIVMKIFIGILAHFHENVY